MQPTCQATQTKREPLPALDRRNLEGWPNRAHSSFLRAAELRWHVQRMGEGPSLLLIHGTGSASLTWRDIMPALARSYDVVAMDLPGHGLTDSVEPRRMSLEAISDALGELLHAMNVSPRVVVGHSAGMAIALRMALDHHISATRLIGINAALMPYWGPLAWSFSRVARLCSSLPLLSGIVAGRAADRSAIERLIEGTGSALDADGIALYQRLFTDRRHVRSVLAMMGAWNLESLLDEIGPLGSQISLIVGDRDLAVSPAEAEAVQSRHPRIGISRMPGVGHLAHEERPNRAVRMIRTMAQSGA